MNIYANETDAFDDEEVELLDNLGNNLVYGLTALRTHLEKKRSAELLRQSEEKYHIAFRSSPDAIVLTSLDDGCIVEINDMGLRLTGYHLNEIIGRTTEALNFWANPVDRERYIGMFKKDGRVNNLEADFRTKSGEIRTGLVAGEIIHLQTGLHILGVIRDITERKRAEKALRESESKYQDLYDNAPDMFVSVNSKTGAIISCNKTLVDVLDYKKEEIIGRPIFDVYAPDSAKRAKEVLFPLFLKTGSIQGEELQIQRKDGSKIDVSLNSSAVRDDQGNIIYSRSIWRDITERKRVEEALRESEAQFRALFNNASEGILVAELKSKQFRFANPAICQMLGYSEEELIGMKVTDIHPEESLDHVISEFEAQARGEKKLAPSIPCRRKDGQIIYSDINAAKANIQRVEYNIGLFTDITERKAVEIDLANKTRVLEKMVDELTESRKEIEETKNDLSLSQDIAHIGGWKYDVESDELCWSDELLKLYGLYHEMTDIDVEYAIGMTHPDDRSFVQETFERALVEGIPYEMNYRIIRPDKKERFVQAIGKLEKNEKGEVIRAYGTVQDITESKQVEAELRKHREHLEELVKERTAQLEDKIAEIERLNKVFVGRELRMVELKAKIKDLEARIQNP